MKGAVRICVIGLRIYKKCGLMIKPVHKGSFCVMEMEIQPNRPLIIPFNCLLIKHGPLPLQGVNNSNNALKRC